MEEPRMVFVGEEHEAIPACIEWVRGHANLAEAIIDTSPHEPGCLPCFVATIKLKFKDGVVKWYLAETGRGPVKFVPTPRVVEGP